MNYRRVLTWWSSVSRTSQ